MAQRKIIHIDMDAYYASVEQRDDPSLRGKPLIVGGSAASRGVVCTASYEARKFGLRSGMATRTAQKLCPQVIVVPPDFKKYSAVTRQLISFYREYTDLIEPLSLDECYLDVSENKLQIPHATEIAKRLQHRIITELQLSASAGVAPNKFLAKVASDYKKPGGLTVIKPHQIEQFMQTLPVKQIWGVGKVTEQRMHSLGMYTCADVQQYSEQQLSQRFGSFGKALYEFARGIDERPVITEYEMQSAGSETTFPEDSTDISFITAALEKECASVAYRLEREQTAGRTVTLKVKYSDFKSITRRTTLDVPVRTTEEICTAARRLFAATEIGSRPIRLIGVSVTNFIKAAKLSIDQVGYGFFDTGPE